MDEESSAIEVDRSGLCDDGAFYSTTWPESMVHGSPRLLGIGAEVTGAILSGKEPWSCPLELQVDNAFLRRGRLDVKLISAVGQLD